MRRATGLAHSIISSASSRTALASDAVTGLSAAFEGSSLSSTPPVPTPSVAAARRSHVHTSSSSHPPSSLAAGLHGSGNNDERGDEQQRDEWRAGDDGGASADPRGRTGRAPVAAAAATALALPTLLDSDDVRSVRDEMVSIMENKEFSPEQVTVFSSVCRIAEDKNVQTAIFQNPEFRNLFYASQGNHLMLEAMQPQADPSSPDAASTPASSVPAVGLTPEEFVQSRMMLCHKCARTVTIEEYETDADEHRHSDSDDPAFTSGSPGTPPMASSPLSSMAGAAGTVIPLVCATLLGVLFVKYGDLITVTIDAVVHRIDLREWGRFLILGAMESFFGRKFASRKL